MNKRALALSLMLVACGDDDGSDGRKDDPDAAARADGAMPMDARMPVDARVTLDATGEGGNDGRPDGGGSDAATSAKTYALCDGSDDVRLVLRSGGGYAPSVERFVHPYGYNFLYVDGHCNFATKGDGPGRLVTGTLTAAQGEQLSKSLNLGAASGIVYYASDGCLDGGAAVVVTADAYLEDRSCRKYQRPAQVADAFEWTAPLALVKSLGQPASGAVAIAVQASAASDGSVAWPFSFPVDEALWSADAYGQPLRRGKALTGADATLARQLWASESSKPSPRSSVPVTSGGDSFVLYFRDELDEAFASKAAALVSRAGPYPAIARCEPGRKLATTLMSPSLSERIATVALTADTPCGVELCWDGTFQEKLPVATQLSLQSSAQARTCLGMRELTVSAELSPIVDAFRAGYPNTAVQVDLGFGTLLAGEASCKLRDVERCDRDPSCSVIMGASIDFFSQCARQQRVPYGCAPSSRVCNAVPTQANSQGSLALFSDSCVPEGWTPYGTGTLPTCAP